MAPECEDECREERRVLFRFRFSLREFLWLPKITQPRTKRVLFSNLVTLECFARPLKPRKYGFEGFEGSHSIRYLVNFVG